MIVWDEFHEFAMSQRSAFDNIAIPVPLYRDKETFLMLCLSIYFCRPMPVDVRLRNVVVMNHVVLTDVGYPFVSIG